MQDLCAFGKAIGKYSQDISVLERTREIMHIRQTHVISKESSFSDVPSAVLFEEDTFC